MKKLFPLAMLLMAGVIVTACSSDDYATDTGTITTTDGSSSSNTSYSSSLSDLTSFDIALDATTALSETNTVDASDEDYIENNTFGDIITIAYNGTSATVSGSVSGVTVTTSGADVTVNSTVGGVKYILTGTTTDGSFKVYSSKKYAMELNGVSITNSDGPAINSQSSKRAYVILASGTTNTLTDGTSYASSTEDQKGTLFAEGKLLFSGSGKLVVNANTKAGISSDDYITFRPTNNIYVTSTKGNGIKANDAINIKGGIINVTTSGTAAKGISSDGIIDVTGGRTTIVTTCGGEYDSDEKDAKGSAGIKVDSTFTMSAGTLLVKSTGAGGKGINCDQDINISGGTLKVITTGAKYTYSSSASTSAKGITADGNLTISGGNVTVRATGGDGSEGIESKNIITISGGVVQSYCYDDGINASNAIVISGGEIFAMGTNNDGIDSNGTITVSGGTTIAVGTSQPEEGFDCDENTFTITGGTLIGLGGGSSTPTSSTTTQPVFLVGGSSLTKNTYFSVNSSTGTNILAFQTPVALNQYTLLVSSPSLSKGSTYTVRTGATVSGGTNFDGYVTGATVSGGTSLASLTLSSYVTTSNVSSGMGGNGGPGGR